jgi:hypothetical protein
MQQYTTMLSIGDVLVLLCSLTELDGKAHINIWYISKSLASVV